MGCTPRTPQPHGTSVSLYAAISPGLRQPKPLSNFQQPSLKKNFKKIYNGEQCLGLFIFHPPPPKGRFLACPRNELFRQRSARVGRRLSHVPTVAAARQVAALGCQNPASAAAPEPQKHLGASSTCPVLAPEAGVMYLIFQGLRYSRRCTESENSPLQPQG